ncbi:MAG: trigger factor [Ruminococcus sp.]|nr:trigger factor [Ruminococcus sp.]
MKKKILAAALCAAMTFSLAGCSSELSNEYITVKQYKGLEVAQVEKTEVTDEDVESAISNNLAYAATTEDITDKAAELGNYVEMDYVGSVDGVEFDGGTAEGATLELGSGSYIGACDEYEGFEDQIVGHKTGEEFDITVKFPEDYTGEEVAGKVANFHIKLNRIYNIIEAELTDEWVAENSEESTTVDEYREEVRTSLEEDAEETWMASMQDAVAQALLEQIEVKSLPEDQVTEQYDEVVAYYEQYASMYGVDMTDFVIGYMGMESLEAFEEQAQASAEDTVKTILAMELIAEKQKLTVTEEDILELAELYGYEDSASFIEQYGEELINQSVIYDKVTEYLVEECIQVEAAE